MQTQPLCPPLFSRNMLSNTQNQFFIIVQNTSKIFMMIPPVAKTREMANHGGFGGRHGQNRRWKDKINVLGGKRLNFVFWRRLAHRAMSGTWRSASNLQSSSVRIFCLYRRRFSSFLKGRKKCDGFSANDATIGSCFLCSGIPPLPFFNESDDQYDQPLSLAQHRWAQKLVPGGAGCFYLHLKKSVFVLFFVLFSTYSTDKTCCSYSNSIRG